MYFLGFLENVSPHYSVSITAYETYPYVVYKSDSIRVTPLARATVTVGTQ